MRIYLQDDWIRTAYYDRMTTICEELFSDSPPQHILEYAGVRGIIPLIISQFTEVTLTLAPYPAYDIQEKQFPDEEFDVVIADQVLEHTPYPWKAIEQCVGIVKHGGILMFGSPWVYPWHAAPKDYWRISRDAYEQLFEDYGVEVIEIGGWGSRAILEFACETDGLLTINRTVKMAEEAGLFEIENDPDYALEVWAIGRKL